jgi:hypothetical protein
VDRRSRKPPKRPAKKTKRRLEFSKRIFIGVTIGTVSVSIFSMVMAWRTQDTSVLAYLIPAVFAELATATGFYYRKSEKENTKGGIVYDTAMADRECPETPPEEPPDDGAAG